MPPSDPRRTDVLPSAGTDWSASEPVNPGWRKERVTPRKGRKRAAGLPGSPQELPHWLQAGGWRYIAIVGALVVVGLIAALAVSRNDRRNEGFGAGRATGIPTAETSLLREPSVTTAPTVAAPAAPQSFVVAGTDGQGLFLRADPSTESQALATLPDGTRIEQTGEDFAGPDRVWRKVRTADGLEGWVAVDYLQPAP
jgi:hypothetical protein